MRPGPDDEDTGGTAPLVALIYLMLLWVVGALAVMALLVVAQVLAGLLAAARGDPQAQAAVITVAQWAGIIGGPIVLGYLLTEYQAIRDNIRGWLDRG